MKPLELKNQISSKEIFWGYINGKLCKLAYILNLETGLYIKVIIAD